MNLNPRVSIIVPVYNREVLLKKTLSSLENQTYKDFEVIVVDDHSTDNSAKIARNFENRLALEVIVLPKNEGESNAVNVGWRASKNNFIAIVNSDDPQLPNWLEDMVEGIKSNIGYGIYYPDRLVVNIDDEILCKEQLSEWNSKLVFEELKQIISAGAIFSRIEFPVDFVPRQKDVVFPSDAIQILEMSKYTNGKRIAGVYGCWRLHSNSLSSVRSNTSKGAQFKESIGNWLLRNREYLNANFCIDRTYAHFYSLCWYYYRSQYSVVKSLFFLFSKTGFIKVLLANPLLLYYVWKILQKRLTRKFFGNK